MFEVKTMLWLTLCPEPYDPYVYIVILTLYAIHFKFYAFGPALVPNTLVFVVYDCNLISNGGSFVGECVTVYYCACVFWGNYKSNHQLLTHCRLVSLTIAVT